MNAPVRHAALAAEASAEAALIRLEGVSKTFTAGPRPVTALAGVDLAVPPGAVLGVIGRSGAGKSTLIRLVNGLETPSEGRVIVDGREISRLGGAALREARRSIGMIFQHFNLLSSRTAAGNVALPLELAGVAPRAAAARVAELLDLVGLADNADRYPAELSGGQKQRVGIARALAQRPKVILADEPVASLDPKTSRNVLRYLQQASRDSGIAVICNLHQVEFAREFAQRIVGIAAGRVVFEGTPEQLTEDVLHRIYPGGLEEALAEPPPEEEAAAGGDPLRAAQALALEQA
ncbi:MAG TPA: ATP-binding cassette domain-containing protein [Salinarimonas sp.]|nr:ATP-binding cassette domain-containing protein [Salinarimonas sp.]